MPGSYPPHHLAARVRSGPPGLAEPQWLATQESCGRIMRQACPDSAGWLWQRLGARARFSLVSEGASCASLSEQRLGIDLDLPGPWAYHLFPAGEAFQHAQARRKARRRPSRAPPPWAECQHRARLGGWPCRPIPGCSGDAGILTVDAHSLDGAIGGYDLP